MYSQTVEVFVQKISRQLVKILLVSIWEALVGWLRFKSQTDPVEASKAIAEMHQRAVDTR